MSNNLIKLNVRGMIFEIERNVLLSIPYFKHLYETCEDNTIPYINRSPYSFDAIITYITDLEYKIPEEYVYDLNFYDIVIDKKRINSKFTEITKNVNMVVSNQETINNILISQIAKNINKIISNQETVNNILISHSNELLKLNNKIDKINYGLKDIISYQINVGTKKEYYHECDVCGNNTKYFIHKDCIDKYKKCNKKNCKNKNANGSKYCELHIKSCKYCHMIQCINQNMNSTGLCFLHS